MNPKKATQVANFPHYIKGEEIEREFFKAIEPFERKLAADEQAGRPTWFEVRVGGLKVIPKTNDQSAFANLLDFIDLQSTSDFEIWIYQGASTHHDRHLFYFQRRNGTAKEEITLDGINNKIQEGIAEARRNWDHELLVADHAKLKKDFASLEEYADKIEEELTQFRAKKLHIGNIDLVEIGGMFLEGFVRRNPRMLAKLPGGEALAGAIMQDNEERNALPPSGQEALIERSDGSAPQEDPHLNLLRHLQTVFTKADFEGAMTVLDFLAQRPDLIPKTETALRREVGGRPGNDTDTEIETTKFPDNV
jgi:hypothetical protein